MPLIPKLPDVDAVVQRYDEKLDRVIELLELIATSLMFRQGLTGKEITDLLKPKK